MLGFSLLTGCTSQQTSTHYDDLERRISELEEDNKSLRKKLKDLEEAELTERVDELEFTVEDLYYNQELLSDDMFDIKWILDMN